STPEDLITQTVTQCQGILQCSQRCRILPLATLGQAPAPGDPEQDKLQVVRVCNSETLLQKPQRLLILPPPAYDSRELVESKPFTAWLSGLPAGPQRFFTTVSGFVEFAGHAVSEGDDEKAPRQDVLIADLRGERLRLV